MFGVGGEQKNCAHKFDCNKTYFHTPESQVPRKRNWLPEIFGVGT